MLILTVITNLIAFIRPRLGLTLFIILIFLPVTLVEDIWRVGLGRLKILPYLIAVSACAGSVFFDGLRIRKFYKYVPPLAIWALSSYVVILFVSGYINGKTLLDTVFTLRWVVGLVTVTYLASRYYTMDDLHRLMRVLILLGISQIPVTIIQRFYLVPILEDIGDVVTGTFPQYYQLLFYLLILIGTVIKCNNYGIRFFRMRTMYLVTLLIVPLVFSNAKAAFIYLPLVLIFSSYKTRFNLVSAFKILLLSLPVILGGLYIFDQITQKTYGLSDDMSFAYMIDFDYIWHYTTQGLNSMEYIYGFNLVNADFGRVANIMYNFKAISKSLETFLFGLGGIFFMESSAGEVVNDVNIPYILHSTITRTIGITGILGTIAVLLFYYSIRPKWLDLNMVHPPGYYIKNSLSSVTFVVLFLTSVYFNNMQSFWTYLIIAILYLPPGRSHQELFQPVMTPVAQNAR